MSLPAPIKALLRYVRRVLKALDRLGNALLLGGDPDQTISLRAAISQRNGRRFGCYMCKFLDIFQKDHCDIVYTADVLTPVDNTADPSAK